MGVASILGRSGSRYTAGRRHASPPHGASRDAGHRATRTTPLSRIAFRASLILLLLIWGASVRAQGVSLEFRVKAAYLYNFVKFVEWPPEAPSGPITICVAGRNPFGPVLADTLRGAQVNGRALASRVITGPDPGCHVLYVPEGTSPEPYLRAARTAPILTVGETPDFLRDGGDIRFTRENGRVRFEINALAAERTDLRISSRLLQVAQMVEGTP